jgi:AraC family transcriptional regulator, transcriptional activator of pobA
VPWLPSVSVEHWAGEHPPESSPTAGTHAHDFLVLLYVERGDDALRVDDRDWPLTAGDAFVIAPGAVVAPLERHANDDEETWAVFFPADAVDPAAAAPLVSWRTHPLPCSSGSLSGGCGRRDGCSPTPT